MDDQQQNPEKIPMNPMRDQSSDNHLYESPASKPPQNNGNPVLKGMFKRPKQEPTIPLKYQLFLAAIMIVFIIASVIVGMVLFRNGLI